VIKALILRSIPIALTIGAYGIIFGAGAKEPLGVGGALLSSAVIFSGALQFAFMGLVLSGASAAAIVGAAVFLNTRHFVLGAVLRPKIDAPRVNRLGLAWWLVDEAAALAIADEESPRRTLLVCGTFFYLAWIAGTGIGLVIGGVSGIAEFAEQFAPVLFVGLAALLVTSRTIVLRALIAAALTYLAIALLPGDKAFLGLIVSVLVALPGRAS
jgi:predicted branched-subunit amino acid permease